jgi:SM-20-related protein
MHIQISEKAGSAVRPPPSAAAVNIHDECLSRELQEQIIALLNAPDWAYGAYSDPSALASRYWYKHYAGYVKDGREDRTPGSIELELREASPLLGQVWDHIKNAFVPGHNLTRCYANAYPFGSEGGLHADSNIETHLTIIYYPHLAWHPNYGGETVFFSPDGADIIASVYPRPNRLVIFPGVIPHVARGVTRVCPELRTTLMFKTAPG